MRILKLSKLEFGKVLAMTDIVCQLGPYILHFRCRFELILEDIIFSQTSRVPEH